MKRDLEAVKAQLQSIAARAKADASIGTL